MSRETSEGSLSYRRHSDASSILRGSCLMWRPCSTRHNVWPEQVDFPWPHMWCLNLFSAVLTSGGENDTPSHAAWVVGCIVHTSTGGFSALLTSLIVHNNPMDLQPCKPVHSPPSRSVCVRARACVHKCHFSRKPTPTAGDIFTGEMSPQPFSPICFVYVHVCVFD